MKRALQIALWSYLSETETDEAFDAGFLLIIPCPPLSLGTSLDYYALDSSIVDGKIQVKTAKDVALLINAYVKLAEAENKVIISLAHLAEVFNARDALTAALVSASTTDESLLTHFSPALTPVFLSDSEDGVGAV